MAQITPNEFSAREFTKSLRGYNPVEVDDYINRVLEGYTKLQSENAALEGKLAETNKKLQEAENVLNALKSDDVLIREALVTAKKAGDAAIAEAYGRADQILASAKAKCDTILQSFRDEVEAQKQALNDMQQKVREFKNDLFDKYRLHIELIEQLSPVCEYEEELSPEEYVSQVVSELKQDMVSQNVTENAEANMPPDTDFAPTMDFSDMTAEIKRAKKKKDGIPSVQSILREDSETKIRSIR